MRTMPSIATMTPDKILRKSAFKTPVPSLHPGTGPIAPANALSVYPLDNLQFEARSQADFLREFSVSSHRINSIKYYPNSFFLNKDTGKLQAKVHSRIAVAFQERIKTKRKTALIGNNVGMKLISTRAKQKGEDLLARYREGWEECNMEIAIDKAIDSDYTTADCAVYIFRNGDTVGWRAFSYLDGDMLYPHYDPYTGELALFGRRYKQEDDEGNEVEYLDVIDRHGYIIYRLDATNKESKWVVDVEERLHGYDFCPVAYHRRRTGPVWSASQSLIDNYEMSLSQFAENNAAYALRILYTLGGEMEVMTNIDGSPTRIDSPDYNAKVGFLEPAAGADTAFAAQLSILEKNIMRCSFAVETPELKSGSDTSSLTVKMLFADSYLKALEDSQEYQLFLDKIAKMFRLAYGTVSGMESNFSDFRVKTYLEPFVFMSESEVINAIQQLTAAGVLSKQTATEIAYNSGYGTADEWDRILKEAQAELVAEQKTQAQAAAKSNPVSASRSK